MNTKQAILQIAELVVNLSSDKPYRKAHSKEEIVKELNDGIVSGKFDGIVTDTFLKYYDEIMEKAMEKAASALVLYQKLQRNSVQVYKNFTK